MKQYGVMVIGCGYIGLQHLADIYYRDNVCITAVVDSEIDRARDAAKKYNALQYGADYRPFLKEAGTQIVIIATNVRSHLSILQDCLAAGKHVLCEKPIASTLEEGEAFCRTVKEAKSKVLVAHVLRHNRSYMAIHDLLQSGVIGRLRIMRMVQNHHTIRWERVRGLLEDCPPAVDCGVHYFDVMQWFSGAHVTQVSGIGTTIEHDSPNPNYELVTARLDNGCVAYYEAGWSKSVAFQNLKEFIGDKGRITLELQDNRQANREEGDLITVYHADTGEYQTINLQSEYKDMYGQLQTLVDMIENDAPANPTMDEVFSAFRVAMAADQAIRENRIIFLNE